MIKDIILKLGSSTEKKSALTELKSLLKEDSSRELKKLPKEDFSALIRCLSELLKDNDPKIRKNSGACIGSVGQYEEICREAGIDQKDIVDSLFQAYTTEQTKYNMAAYIEALGRLDFSSVKKNLLKRRDDLCISDIAEEDKKHVIEEMRELNRLLRDDIEKKHEFTGYDLVNEAALLTNRNYKNITIEELGKIPHREYNAGVMVKTKNIRKVLECRTFTEMLFVPGIDAGDDGSQDVLSGNIGGYAAGLINNGLTGYIAARHSNPEAPFYFRVEVKCRDTKKKSELEKKLASEIEYCSRWKLINSTGNYDLEFRFVESSSGKLQFLIGMRTIPDNRFSYRRHTISAGMKPSLAALLVRLSKDHISDNAAVLDPVCGSGIFLIERELYKPARILYGIDIFGDAVKAAAENINAAGFSKKCELINKDFTQFRHQYRFNEIYADMPRITSGKDSASIERFYMEFMDKARNLLEEDGHLFVFTHNRNILRRYSAKYGYSVIAEYEVSKMEEAYYFIFEVK